MLFHDFTFAGTLVVNATQVKHAMNNDAQELAVVGLPYPLGISGNGVQGDEHIASEESSHTGVKRNYIGKIVVLKELDVDLKNARIVAKNIRKATHNLSMSAGYGDNPILYASIINLGQWHAVTEPLYISLQNYANLLNLFYLKNM